LNQSQATGRGSSTPFKFTFQSFQLELECMNLNFLLLEFKLYRRYPVAPVVQTGVEA
jgi:hypothetical protein